MSYVYVRKDITFIPSPDSQALTVAFLKALYSYEYSGVCEDEFGFVPVSGNLRERTLQAIDSLVISDAAPLFTFETNTQRNTGMNDYVISFKRQSYSEIEQDQIMDLVATLQRQIDTMKAENELIQKTVSELETKVSESCVKNDSDWRFITNTVKVKNCNWVAIMPTLRCRKVGYYLDDSSVDVTARDACRLACSVST
jgi:hypothetical protein